VSIHFHFAAIVFSPLDSIISKSSYHEKSVLQAPCIPAISAIKKDFSTINKLYPHFMLSPTIICIEKVAMLDDLLSFKQKYGRGCWCCC
jgi:hypothetical protein